MKLPCPASGCEVEPTDVVFDDTIVVPNNTQLDELAARIGSDWFRVPSANDREVLPLVSVEKLELFLEAHTDLIVEHSKEHWSKVEPWSWH